MCRRFQIPRCARNDKRGWNDRGLGQPSLVISTAPPCHFATLLLCHFDRRGKSCVGGFRFLAALGMTKGGCGMTGGLGQPSLVISTAPPCHFAALLLCHFDRREKSCASSLRFLAGLGMTKKCHFDRGGKSCPTVPKISRCARHDRRHLHAALGGNSRLLLPAGAGLAFQQQDLPLPLQSFRNDQ